MTARSYDDLILDGIIDKIDAVRAADALANPGLDFELERDRTRPWQELKKPLVFATLEADTPDGRRNYTARYSIWCAVPTSDDDETASLRLYFLKEQVRSALLAIANYNMSQPTGIMGRVNYPTWAPANFDDERYSQTVLAGTWTLEVLYAYDRKEPDHDALEQIEITAARWAALYDYTGGTP